jgi:arylsulfatase A-like enzyme
MTWLDEIMSLRIWVFLVILNSAYAKPNFVIFLADDLGYGDVGYQGGNVPTPQIDSIAKDGVVFTDGYVSCPVCAPSRAGILTGRYQQSFGFWDNVGPFRVSSEVKPGIPLEIPILSERLNELGYICGLFGKTHEGDSEEMMAFNRWDEFFGFNNGASNYLPGMNHPHNPIFHNKKIISRSYEKRGINRDQIIKKGVLEIDREQYLTDLIADYAVSFIEENHDRPFLCYLPFNAIHGPFQAHRELYEKYKSEKNHQRRLNMAMLDSMDHNIGRVLKILKKLSLEEDTMVIFLSDNGGHEASPNLPLRGKKATYWEGGLRVPFCMKWPSKIEAGELYRKPVISLDLFPTIVRAAGGNTDPSHKLDGVDLMPYLNNSKQGDPHRNLFWIWGSRKAIRTGDFKAMSQDEGKSWQLYNLRNDISEQYDLADERALKLEQLIKKFNAWEKELIPQQWGWRPDLGHRDVNFGKPKPYHDPKYFRNSKN